MKTRILKPTKANILHVIENCAASIAEAESLYGEVKDPQARFEIDCLNEARRIVEQSGKE